MWTKKVQNSKDKIQLNQSSVHHVFLLDVLFPTTMVIMMSPYVSNALIFLHAKTQQSLIDT